MSERGPQHPIGAESPSAERELPSEVFERVMEKVRDIDADGTAYSVIRSVHSLINPDDRTVAASVFRHGLLGTDPTERRRPGKPIDVRPITPQEWARGVRSGRRERVYFNIVGRAAGEGASGLINHRGVPELRIGRSAYMEDLLREHARVAFTFDLSRFDESSPRSFWDREPKRAGEYHAVFKSPGAVSNVDAEDHPKQSPIAEYGFELSWRVATRNLLGVVFADLGKQRDEAGVTASGREIAAAVVAIMREAYADHPERMLPVYDLQGNLYWPKEMPYADVQTFATKRSADRGQAR